MSRNGNELVSTFSMIGRPRSTVDARLCYDVARQWFADYGVEPDKVSLEGPEGFPSLRSYKQARNRVEEVNWSQVVGFDLIAVEPKADPLIDYEMYFDLLAKCRSITMSASIALVNEGTWGDLIRKLRPGYQVAYGYGHVTPRSFGSVIETCGYAYTDDADEEFDLDKELYESHLPMHWASTALDRQDHPNLRYAIRSVYPYQVLTAHHLELRLGQATLGDWIGKDKRRGRLEVIGEGLWSWTLDDPDRVASARLALYRAGLLWAWWPGDDPEPDIHRPLPPPGALVGRM